MELSLRGRTALVTGAAQGIGRAIAIEFARAGADIAICDRDDEGLRSTASAIEETGRKAISGLFDVRDGAAAAAFVAEVVGVTGTIELLVNNAGGGFVADFMDVNEKGEDALIRENFTSVTAMIRLVVPLMPESGGAIINISSIEAHRAGPGYAIYSAMKAAQENLAKPLALELSDRSIRVNAIAPDAIPTPGLEQYGPAEIPRPLPYAGRPEDVAGAALFLASDAARFITGTVIHVDGGNHAAAAWKRGADGGVTL